jgi:hypothetical protein
VDVATAVREDCPGSDPDDEQGSRVGVDQRVVVVDRRVTVEPQAGPVLEVDEEQPDGRVLREVAGGQEHPVAVVDREGDGRLVDHADEAGVAALVRALRLPRRVSRRDEEHVPGLDEAPERRDDVARGLRQPVSQPPGVVAILQLPV